MKFNPKSLPQIAIFTILLVGFLYFSGFTGAKSVIGSSGFSTLSLTQGTSYISSDPFLNGPSYSLVVVADGSGGSARGTITPSMISDFTGGKAPAEPFDIQVDVINESCSYTLLNTTPQYTYHMDIKIINNLGSWPSCYSESTVGVGYQPIESWTDGGGFTGTGYSIACGKRMVDGQILLVDSVAQYDTNIRVKLITKNETREVYLGSLNKNAEIPNILRASILGSLVGSQSCPQPAIDTVIYRQASYSQYIRNYTSQTYYQTINYSTTLLPKNRVLYNTIYSESFIWPSSRVQAAQFESNLANFKNSIAPSSSYCNVSKVSVLETRYSCQPYSSVSIPLIKMVVKADALSVVVPNGIPKIISYEAPVVEAAETTNIRVKVSNLATEQDSFDVVIIGKREINTQPVRVNLLPGEEKTVDVKIQGAGIIGNYTIKMTSVNNPTKIDTMPIRILINPFCDKPPVEGRVKISTEYGCFWICPQVDTANPDSEITDVRELRCQPFGSFEPSGKAYDQWDYYTTGNGSIIYSSILQNSESHCIGVGKYQNLDYYMDRVYQGKQQPFIPQPQEHTYWIDGKVCNYVGEYGYKWNGFTTVMVDDEEYQYATPTEGSTTTTVVNPPTTGSGGVGQNTTIGGVIPPDTSGGLPSWGIPALVVVISGLAYLRFGKGKKR